MNLQHFLELLAAFLLKSGITFKDVELTFITHEASNQDLVHRMTE